MHWRCNSCGERWLPEDPSRCRCFDRQSETTASLLNVVAFKREPHPDIIRKLEELLERARAGDILAFAAATQSPDSSTATVYEIGDGDVAHLVCAIEGVKMRLLGYGPGNIGP